jgi:uncharacterized membrane protein YdbT with pleckstrin-like domain
MSKIVNPEQYAASTEAKGKLCYKETGRLLFLAIPWPFTKYEIYENVLTITKGFLSVSEDDCYMYKISDVEIKRSFCQRIVGLSTIVLFTSDVTDRTIVMKNIKHGREIKDFLLQASEASKLRRRTVSMQNISFGAEDIHDIDGMDEV